MKLPRCSSLTEASIFSHLACLNRQTTSQKQPRGVHVSNLRVTYETVRCLLFWICLDMLAMVVSESSFGAYVCLTRPAGSTATSALVDVSVFMSNSPIEQELSICKTTRLFVGSSPLSCGLKPSFTKICKLAIFCFAKPPYRRVSHGLGLPANAILFLPFVKGNQKLRNTSAPTVSIAHQTDFPSITPDVFCTISFNAFREFCCKKKNKKTWRWLATQDHAKLVYSDFRGLHFRRVVGGHTTSHRRGQEIV